MNKVTENVAIEGAKIIFRNFSGKGTAYNPEGTRNFCVLIDSEETAANMIADGWNVKPLKPKDEDAERKFILKVTVSFDRYPPKVWLVKKANRILLDENTIGSLDYAEITNVDLIIRPYNWEVGNTGGVKAYAKTMIVTVAEDDFADKYDFLCDDELPFGK